MRSPQGHRPKDEVPYATSRAFEIRTKNGDKAKMARGTAPASIRRGQKTMRRLWTKTVADLTSPSIPNESTYPPKGFGERDFFT
jgi:hypothetical protein